MFAEQALVPLERGGLVDLTRVGTAEEGRRLAADGDVQAAFVVPQGFTADVTAGGAAAIEVIGNADARIATQVARSIAAAFAGELNGVRLAVATAAAYGGDDDPAELARQAASLPAAVAVEDVSAERRELDAETFYAAGMAVFFLFFTVQFGITSLLDERREGTLARLVAAPISRLAILGGKLLTSYALGVVATFVLIVATSFLLGADWGDPIGVALLVLVGVLAATSVMALVATVTRTPEQAGYAGSVVALVLGMLGGSFFPISQVGGAISTLSLLTPHAWFLRGLAELTGGGGVGDILPAFGAILAFAAVTGAVAVTRLERAVQP